MNEHDKPEEQTPVAEKKTLGQKIKHYLARPFVLKVLIILLRFFLWLEDWSFTDLPKKDP